MLNKLYRFIDRIATWPVAALLLVVMLLCWQGFSIRQKALGYENQILDVRQSYNPAVVAALFASLGPAKTTLYAVTQLSLDLAFPLAYGTLFMIFTARLFGEKRAWLILIPFLAMLCDISENISIAIMAFTYDGNPPALASLAVVFTLAKTVLFIVSGLLLLVGGIIGLRRR